MKRQVLKKMWNLRESPKIITHRFNKGYNGASCSSLSFSVSMSSCSSEYRFEYCSPDTVYKYKNVSITKKRELERNNENRSVTFSCSNDEFFEMVKKLFKKEKHNFDMWNKYCRELMYRINDTNISPQLITKVFSLLCYTDFKNEKLLSEILNRCILRIHEFDLIHICSFVNSLGTMNFKHMYFLDEVKKRLMSARQVEYFEKENVCHYISLMINSLIKLRYVDMEFLTYLIEKIHKRKIEESSLLGLSLFLYNISKLKLSNYYDMFKKCEVYFIQRNKELGNIQIMNILSAYNNVNQLTKPLLLSLLFCIKERISSLHLPTHLQHLLRPLKISLIFVTRIQRMEKFPDEVTNKILFICSEVFNEIHQKINKGGKKELITLCSLLSKHKKLVTNENGIYNTTILKNEESLSLFQKLNQRIKSFVNTFNHVEASIVLHSYSLYKMCDFILFNQIKLRSLRIFSTFNETTFCYLFQAFANFHIKDKVFQKCCLHKLTELNTVHSFSNLCVMISTLSKIRLDEIQDTCEWVEVIRFISQNSKRFLMGNFNERNMNKENDLNGLELNRLELNRLELNKQDIAEENVKMEGSKLTCADVSILALLLSKLNTFDSSDVMEPLLSIFEKRKADMRTEHLVSFLVSLSNLSKNIKTVKSRMFWKRYYNCINELVKTILQKNPFCKYTAVDTDTNKNVEVTVDTDTNKNIEATVDTNVDINVDTNVDKVKSKHKCIVVDFLNGCAKVFHPYAASIICEWNDTLEKEKGKGQKKILPVYLRTVLESIIENLFYDIEKMTIGEIGITLESLNKENYSFESINAILKNRGELFFAKLLNRCKLLLNGELEENKDMKNIIIIINNLTKIDLFDKKLFHCIIKNCICTLSCLNSLFYISHSIYFICTYVFIREHIFSMRKIRLLDFLIKRLHDLLINTNVIFYKKNQLLVCAEEMESFSKNVLFYKSFKDLYESFLILTAIGETQKSIADFSLENSSVLEDPSFSFKNRKNKSVVRNDSRTNENPNRNSERHITLGLLNTLNHLRLFFCIMMIGERLNSFQKIRAVDKISIRGMNHMVQNMKEMKIESKKISAGFWDIIKLKT